MAKKKTSKKKILRKTKKTAKRSHPTKSARISEDVVIDINNNVIGDDDKDMKVPSKLPVLAASDIVLYPDMIAPLSIAHEKDMKMIDESLLGDKLIIIAPLERAMEDSKDTKAIHNVGCVAAVLKMFKLPEGEMRLLIQGLSRAEIVEYLQVEPHATAKIKVLQEKVPNSIQSKALLSSLRKEFTKLTDILQFPEDIKVTAHNIEHPGRFSDLIASNIDITHEQRLEILDEMNVMKRMQALSVMLGKNMQIVELGNRIQQNVKERIGEGQREYFLREQLKAIRSELGEDDGNYEIEEMDKKLDEAGLPEHAMKEAKRELNRLEKMHSGSAEYTVSMTYLDWMVSLPWNKETKDEINIKRAQEILDADHYNLKKVKERIIEYLAVKKINPEGKSPILCLVGPPGVGKTSLGRSIAKAMNRKFVRHSLGGVRDEAEIRGHRRTYIGALPGRIIQELRRAESKNPVFMLDEIDKLVSDMRGDPSSALLEALDPEQNSEFSDHYLDVNFDLSRVVFIATANTVDTIPDALYDRMEIISLPGYSSLEKHEIAKRYLIPRVLKDHGLKPSQIKFNKTAIDLIMRGYTRESGLRSLERELATIVRKITVNIAKGQKGPYRVTPELVKKLLGPEDFTNELIRRSNAAGVAVGLVWTSVGGDVLFIESTLMPGGKHMQLTGSLGDVIKESAITALSWTRTHAEELGIDPDFYENSDIHIHFPEGATPKDGPSAGVTLITSLFSLLLNKRVKSRLAMTGEITLRGKVLPVGGIKEKMIGAHLAGIKEVVLPKLNMKDLHDLPKEVMSGIKFYPVEEVDEVLRIAFPNTFEPGLIQKRQNSFKAKLAEAAE